MLKSVSQRFFYQSNYICGVKNTTAGSAAIFPMLFHIEHLRYQLDDTYAFLQKRIESLLGMV